MNARILLVLAGLTLLASSARAQNAAPGRASDGRSPPPLSAHRTGEFEAVLLSRSPRSERSRWIERFQFPGDLDGWDYDLGAETFSLFVPPTYDPEGEPYGILVWISPFDDGSVPAGLQPVLEARRLIWIGANDAGNDRHLYHRAGLALDAAANVEALYNVDPDRVFVSGMSGGGRVATMEAVDFPDVFAGGFPIVGVTTYLDVSLESNPGQRVLQFPEPPTGILDRARAHPLVILTGSDDFNREECRLTAAAYEEDGFTAVHYVEVEGMGHEMPPAAEFGRGLDLLLSGSD